MKPLSFSFSFLLLSFLFFSFLFFHYLVFSILLGKPFFSHTIHRHPNFPSLHYSQLLPNSSLLRIYSSPNFPSKSHRPSRNKSQSQQNWVQKEKGIAHIYGCIRQNHRRKSVPRVSFVCFAYSSGRMKNSEVTIKGNLQDSSSLECHLWSYRRSIQAL